MASLKPLPGNAIRIHFVTLDETGAAIVSPGTIQGTNIVVPGNRYRVACDHAWKNLGKFPHTSEPRAVTCPECLSSEDFKGAQQ